MADDRTDRTDAADERQTRPRQGLEGKGFDPGTGYGGAGNSALYNGESGYGGQTSQSNNSLGGAYRGEGYGRPGGDEGGMQAAGQEGGDDAAGNVGRDTDGRGSANQGGGAPDPNVEAVTDAFEGRGNEEGSDAGSGGAGSGGAGSGGAGSGGAGGGAGGGTGRVPDAIDLQDMNGASRREPGR